MSLSSEQPPPSTALPAATQTQVFQPVSKAPHSSGINVNAAPFQSMQTVSEYLKQRRRRSRAAMLNVIMGLVPPCFYFYKSSSASLSCKLRCCCNDDVFLSLFFFLSFHIVFLFVAPQVFNLNAPVPPASETEALNPASQYQNSYNQAFSSQHPAEQTELQSEQLQSGGRKFFVCLFVSQTRFLRSTCK